MKINVPRANFFFTAFFLCRHTHVIHLYIRILMMVKYLRPNSLKLAHFQLTHKSKIMLKCNVNKKCAYEKNSVTNIHICTCRLKTDTDLTDRFSYIQRNKYTIFWYRAWTRWKRKWKLVTLMIGKKHVIKLKFVKYFSGDVDLHTLQCYNENAVECHTWPCIRNEKAMPQVHKIKRKLIFKNP